jgi:hypothetical protein
MARYTPKDDERLLMEIRPSAAALANVLDISGATQVLALAQRVPWRAVLCGLGVVIVSAPLRSDLLLGGGLILALALGFVESWHRRDFLTSRRVIRQYGLLGNKRKELQLTEIERVEYSNPRFGRAFGAGDVDVIGIGKGFTFVGVPEPEALAQAILDARQAARAQRPPGCP